MPQCYTAAMITMLCVLQFDKNRTILVPTECFLVSYTVFPEIFARVLFSLNFAVGVRPRKLSSRTFLRTRKFCSRGIHYHLHAVWFPWRCGTDTLLLFISPFSTSSWRCFSFDSCSQLQINARIPSGRPSHTARTRNLATWLQTRLERSAIRRAISLSSEFSLTLVNFRNA